MSAGRSGHSRGAAVSVILFLAVFTVGSGQLFAQPGRYSAPEKDWFTLETKHFTVSYHEGAERTAKVIAKIAEDIHGPLTSLYEHEPDSKVHFVVKDLSDYSNGAAYFFNNKIEIWASPLDFELRGTHNWLRNVIAHEYTHIIQMQTSMKWGRSFPAITFQWFGYEQERRTDVLYGFPNLLVSYPLPGIIVPPWMAEGTAQYMRNEFGYEHWDSHRDMILRCYALSDSMLSWPEMSAFGKTSLGNESVYNAGYNLTRYIAKKYGEQAMVDISRAMAKPFVFTVDGAIDDVLDISGSDLYDEWAAGLREEYGRRIDPVRKHRVEGSIIADVGFGNFFPAYSPDNRSIAYVSNKTSDYFGQSALIVYDLESATEKVLAGGVRSALSWSPDGKKIYYSRYNPPSTYGHLYYDLYMYDVDLGKETRLTHGLRAYNPSCSPDGKTIAFVYAKDGTVNLGLVNMDGEDFREVTKYRNGEQVFSPKWSPDGKQLVFGFSGKTVRSVARIDSGGNGFEVLVGNPDFDCRDPVFAPDGNSVYYSCDRSGIFNIYRYDTKEETSGQITNVIGGAFMPSVDSSGNLAYAAYTSGGYKIALLEKTDVLQQLNADYLPSERFVPQFASAAGNWDWDSISDFDDTEVPEQKARPYKNIFQRMMFFPTIRIDEYNPENTGLSLIKPGVMLYSSDILERLEMLGSASMNVKGERDLYLSFTYRDGIPLFSALEVFPDITLEVYNVTRGTSSSIEYPRETVGVDVDFNLLEFAARLEQNIFTSRTRLQLGYRHSRYTGTIGGYTNPEAGNLVPALDNLYFIGNDIGLSIRHRDIVPARDGEINPVGLSFSFHYDYELNRFNPNGDYELDLTNGIFVPLYTNFNLHKLESVLRLSSRLPWLNHTLSVRLRGATILGPPVDDFFNYYAGGITGMQGYTYYALGGNELYHANVTYRFPIFSNMDFRLGHILFDKLYGGVFYDIGDATMLASEMTWKSGKKDVGFELRMETYSFSMYPTRIFFSGAYGLSDFTRTFDFDTVRSGTPVSYGNEWRWYFGMLFSFSLSDEF